MKRIVTALVVSLWATVSVAMVGQPETEPRGSRRLRLARPHEAARIARVESQMPAVAIAGEPSIALSIGQWMDVFEIPGVSVAVFDRHEMVWAKTYGVKRAGGSAHVTLETLFQAASISKPVTAMAALHFVEAGRWTLDEDINDRLLSWKVPDKAGYSLFRANRTMDAVKVFETNVALYPDDANAYDSLGEGQMAAGLREAAIASYRKSLQMNPRNDRAAEILRKLGVR